MVWRVGAAIEVHVCFLGTGQRAHAPQRCREVILVTLPTLSPFCTSRHRRVKSLAIPVRESKIGYVEYRIIVANVALNMQYVAGRDRY